MLIGDCKEAKNESIMQRRERNVSKMNPQPSKWTPFFGVTQTSHYSA